MLIPSKHCGYSPDARRCPGGKDSGGPPPPDPRMFDVMDKQVKQGDSLLDFIKQNWEDNKPRLAAQDDLNQQVIKSNLDLAQKAGDRADDSYRFYQQQGRPVLSQAFEDAKNWDSQGNIDKARDTARTDVQQQFDGAQQQNNRMLERMGVNPNSGKFAALNNQIAMQKATATAGATNQAGMERQYQGAQMRQQAGNLASGMPATSMGFSGQASGFGSAANGVGASGVAGNLAAQGQAANGMQAVGNMYGSSAGQYNNLYGTQLQGWDAQQKANASGMAGIGQLAGAALGAWAATGFAADGGEVKGSGTGTSDSVPARNVNSGQPIMLSNGEYIVPADVVKAKGVEYFDKLKDRYHTPVHRSNLRSTA